jgi:hypothetical protein
VKKLSEALKRSTTSRMPSARIKLRSDGNYYRYRLDIATELVKNHKADLIQIIE